MNKEIKIVRARQSGKTETEVNLFKQYEKNVAKEIIRMLRDGTRYCKVCDDNWSKGCRCCRMTFVGLIQERYGIEDGED